MKQTVEKLLASADISINGKRPWDIRVYNEDFYSRLLSTGSLGLGESYMEGWWDCDAIDQLIHKILQTDIRKNAKQPMRVFFDLIKAKIINQQTRAKAHHIGEWHYDIGNELYKNMLDTRLNYSCGYWENTDNLDQAQINKLDLICRKVGLKPGMKVLDIGCGWGSFLKYAAEKYKIKGTGITVSEKQAMLARELCQGLDIDIKIMDYRLLDDKFDRVISIGMFEHVGYKNYKTFMRVVDKNLTDEGLFLLHTIGGNKSKTSGDPWIEKYIFPGGMLPSPIQIAKSSEGLFRLEDWHAFGYYYDQTLMAWHKNFNDNWDNIKDNYNERFKRMWNFYLLSCAAGFRSHGIDLWQIVFSKLKARHGYRSVR